MNERTTCQRAACPYQGHVVLYAAGGEFDGHHYRRGQTLVYCLKHGGQIYDAIKAITGPINRGNDGWMTAIAKIQGWLTPYTDNLPTVWADHHNRPGTQTPPWQRATRTAIPERPRTTRRAA